MGSGLGHEEPPIVAVVCRRLSSAASASKNTQGVFSTYIEAIEDVGGAVVLVPLQRLDRAGLILARCDGLLLAGGEDVISERSASTLDQGRVDERRDEVERSLVGQAIRRGIPILGICRGMHLINVECGGTLTNVSQAAAKADRHVNDWRAGKQYVHDVYLSPDSSLIDAAQGRSNLRVNSHHRRCIDQVGAGFVVAAHADDGLIEAIESPEGSYCIGVQWHPECLLDQGDDFARMILTDFVRACQRSRRSPC